MYIWQQILRVFLLPLAFLCILWKYARMASYKRCLLILIPLLNLGNWKTNLKKKVTDTFQLYIWDGWWIQLGVSFASSWVCVSIVAPLKKSLWQWGEKQMVS